MSKEELTLKLPPLPPTIKQSRIEVTEHTFVVWDLITHDAIKAVAFLRGEDGDFTVWTPGRLEDWVWRGPQHISRASAEMLATWLNKGYAAIDVEAIRRLDDNIEVKNDTIWLWNPDPYGDSGLGVLKLRGGAFELSIMGAGLQRGGAYMKSEDGHSLEQWLKRIHD